MIKCDHNCDNNNTELTKNTLNSHQIIKLTLPDLYLFKLLLPATTIQCFIRRPKRNIMN